MGDKNFAKMDISAGAVIKTLAILSIAYILFLIRDVILIVLTAVVIASAIEPGTRWFVERHVPRAVAVVSIYLAFFVLLAGAIYLFIPTLVSETASLLQNLPSQIGSVEISGIFEDSGFLGNLPIGDEGASIRDYIRELQQSFSEYSDGIFRTVAGIFGGLASFVLIVIISFYLAVQKNGIEEFIKVVTPFQHQGYAVDLWKRTQVKIGKWLQGQLLLMLIIGVLTYIGLVILGVPNAFVFAVVAGLFEIIPIFGPILAAIPAIAVAYSGAGLTLALMVAGLYLVVQQLENQVIYPQVVHKVVGVPSLIVLISLLVGANLAGFLGVILSVPIAALLMEFAYDIEKKNVALAEAQTRAEREKENEK
jgi:predicted PurR-regulated permease PerM